MVPTILGGDWVFRRRLVETWKRVPPWYFIPARISRILVTGAPDVVSQVAVYEHGSRDLKVASGVGEALHRAILHELAHGFDDDGMNPHRFSMSDAFVWAWRSQANFEIPKYARDCREHFADMAAKAVLLGFPKLSVAYPNESLFLQGVVWPALEREYSLLQVG